MTLRLTSQGPIMFPLAFSARQTRRLEIVGVCLFIFTMGFGLLYQFKGWKLDGAALIIICIIIINYVNLIQAEFGEVSARIGELEKQLLARRAGEPQA
jgi:hypothetical protein